MRLKAVTETPRRAVAYVRVSKERDEMMSPDLQRASIEAHCARYGYTLVEVLEDLDMSGRFWRRRQVERAIAMIEAGQADVLVVWKVSRVARNRRDWAIAVDRVEAAGGALESATEDVDTTTSTGRFTRGMLAELAAFESERIGETWKEALERRVALGLTPTGRPQWGYQYDKGDKRHHADPDAAPLLVEMYRRYLAGESVLSMVKWLNANGIPTVVGSLWTEQALRQSLDSGFGAGFIRFRGELLPGAQEPVVDRETWVRYLEARSRRRNTGGRSEQSEYLLSGMLRCAACGSGMVAGSLGRWGVPRYRCKSQVQGGWRHSGGYVQVAIVDRAVWDWLVEISTNIDQRAEVHAAQVKATQRRKDDTAALLRQIEKVDEQLVRLTRQLTELLVPEDAYASVRDELIAKRGHLEIRVAELRATQARTVADMVAAADELVDDWDELPVAGRREALKRMISEVEVRAGAPRAEVRVVPIWEAPAG